MSITQTILLNVPSVVVGAIIVSATLTLSVAGLLIVHHFIPHHKLKLHHDVADPILGALGAVYAVLLAFVTVTVWQNFDKTNSNVELEANYLGDIYRDAEAFTPEFRAKAQDLLRKYRQEVITYEWKTMERGQMSPEVEKRMREIWTLYTTYRPNNSTEQSFFDESVRKLNSFRELRRKRIMDSRTGIHPLLWFVLVTGAFATISFTFLFGTENLQAQIIMGILFSMTISLILFTVLLLDFPFTGSITVTPQAFQELLLD